jgi:catechol 2,3-dioxygenase-like lactoylglutathione lyase family enzyme
MCGMDMKVELIPLPVTDVDRAKAFYVDKVGFGVDVDVAPADGLRIVQLTPPGSACSFLLSTGVQWVQDMAPGSVHGVHLVVADIEAARAELLERGVDVGSIDDVGQGVKYAGFRDPDGNLLLLQEMPWRTGAAF